MGVLIAGRWEVVVYADGVCLVTTRRRTEPWLAVWAQPDEDRQYQFETRYRMALDVAIFLNGFGPRPDWLHDMERVGLDESLGVDGSSITALGPTDEAWHYREDDAAMTARAMLMDYLGCKAYAAL